MITLGAKVQINGSSPLSLLASSEEPILSFSQLLKGIGIESKDKPQVLKDGVLLLSLSKEETKVLSPKEKLLALLKSDIQSLKTLESPLELNPQIASQITTKELKILISDAKTYLKDKIKSLPEFKNLDIKDLPKTLKGLAVFAKTLGIDLSKITMEEVRLSAKEPVLTSRVQALEKKAIEIPKEKLKPLESILKATQKAEIVQTQSKEVTKMEVSKPEIVQTQSKEVPKPEIVQTQSKEVPKTEIVQTQSKEVPKTEIVQTQSKEVTKIDINKIPIFKAQAISEFTTEQIVQVRQLKVDVELPKIQKKKVADTLNLLLRGEKVSKNDMFSPDFSVATARVIAPQATTDIAKSLESLIRSTISENPQNTKLDGLNLLKADSFEIKLNEAKQMTRYLSQDVKTAIEDYKSPFTRIKVALNPQKLGSIELTVVQRGKNLHINLSSNNAAINTLALNANDLKLQLTNSGINNAILNFNNNSENSQQGSFGQEQQNPQQRKEAKEEYDYFTNEEKNEEILNSLEIVVPHYA
ncbi:flagellar hook-length control protein FliK [Sulfurimonas sp. SAG-AH-194-C21]|nr:flagellar hook-length control protein FliK [Sulfurimonas sp. SAG-AH-194-C21]MDF1883160.1 flagellar hook-length control protein FliK [Sulfurimonas sp. SAG-AH-194-C21]